MNSTISSNPTSIKASFWVSFSSEDGSPRIFSTRNEARNHNRDSLVAYSAPVKYSGSIRRDMPKTSN